MILVSKIYIPAWCCHFFMSLFWDDDKMKVIEIQLAYGTILLYLICWLIFRLCSANTALSRKNKLTNWKIWCALAPFILYTQFINDKNLYCRIHHINAMNVAWALSGWRIMYNMKNGFQRSISTKCI